MPIMERRSRPNRRMRWPIRSLVTSRTSETKMSAAAAVSMARPRAVPAVSFGVMSSQPNTGTTAQAGATEVTRLEPAGRAAFLFLRHGMGHESSHGKHDQRRRHLGNKSHCCEQRHTALAEWNEPKSDQRHDRGSQSDQIPAARRQSEIGHRPPQEPPEIGRQSESHDGGGSGDGESVLRQDEGQRDGNEAIADTGGKDEEEKNEGCRGTGLAHGSSQT